MIFKLKCWMFGHRRGKRTYVVAVNVGEQAYMCPRCGATWKRKVKT
jgi:uncharacterized C2H2 Zn-finger protein